MATLGIFNVLPIIDIIANGAILDGGDLGEVLMPNRYVPKDAAIDDQVKVFIYTDSQDRLVATTEQPKAQVGEFISLRVKEVNKVGAFLDWGLLKDLLVPYNQQHSPMEVGKYYLVRLYSDKITGRIAASSKLDKFLDIWPAEYSVGDSVDLIIGHRTDLGFKAIINNQHWGLIFQSDIFQQLRAGFNTKGYIKEVRQDGRITLSLSRTGNNKVVDFTEKLLQHLAEHDGFTPYNDKSSPNDIQKVFGVSKKAFKATVGHLLKQGKIGFENNGIKLLVADTEIEKSKS